MILLGEEKNITAKHFFFVNPFSLPIRRYCKAPLDVMPKPSSLCPNVAIIVIAKLQSLRQWHTNDVIVTNMVKVIEKRMW